MDAVDTHQHGLHWAYHMDDESELLRGSTPTLVLAILKDGPQHGYAIAREVNQRAQGALNFKQGTLYPVLHSLERDGLILGAWTHPEGERPRKVYTITDSGMTELARRMNAWGRFSLAVSRILGTTAGKSADEQLA
jgi:PadR family transcriptional regulator PadR